MHRDGNHKCLPWGRVPRCFSFLPPGFLGIEQLSSLWHSRAFACGLELTAGVKKCLVTEHRTVPAAMQKNCQGGGFRKGR